MGLYNYLELVRANKLTEKEVRALFNEINNNFSPATGKFLLDRLVESLEKKQNNIDSRFDAPAGIKLNKRFQSKLFKLLRSYVYTEKRGDIKISNPLDRERLKILKDAKTIELFGARNARGMIGFSRPYYVPAYIVLTDEPDDNFIFYIDLNRKLRT